MKKDASLEGKTILLVHTSTHKEKSFFQIFKRMGLKIVVLDKEKNWASPYVDHWIHADLTNYNDCIQSTKRWMNRHPDIKIDGVLNFWEESVILTSKLVDAFNWIGTPFHIARRVRNKFLFRKFCRENGISAPNYFLAKSREEIKNQIATLKFPVVIKPVYGSSSAFVIKAESLEELLKTYEFAKNSISTHVDALEWDELEFLVEEYIDGDEVDIDILLQNGKIKFWSIADNFQTVEPYFMETGYANPSTLPKPDQDALHRLAEETLEKIGVQNGCIHFEAKSTKLGPVPLEVNLRMGGFEVHPSVKGAWGVDLAENAARIALGEYVPMIERPELPHKYMAAWGIVPEYSGVLSKLEIDESVVKMSFVEEFHFEKELGDAVFAPPQGFDFLGWVAVSGDNSIDSQDKIEKVLKCVDYEIIKFNDASSLGKTQQHSNLDSAVVQKNRILGAAKIEKIRSIGVQDRKKLQIGIAGNLYNGRATPLEIYSTETSLQLQEVLKKRGYQVTFFDFNNLSKVLSDLKTTSIDLMFNVCDRIHGTTLLGSHSAALLDLLQIPYTGSNIFTAGLCNDKIRFKKILQYHDIPMPAWDYAYTMDDHICEELEYPLIVKPANTDGAIGLTNRSVVTNLKELSDQMERIIKGLGRPALIEEFIQGDEFDVCILGNYGENQRVLPQTRYIFSGMKEGIWPVFTYSAKWENDPDYQASIISQSPPRRVNKKLLTFISEIALDTYNIVDCHDYGRSEFRVDKNGNPYLIEINTNPLLHGESAFVDAVSLLGMDQGDLIEEIISMAINRYKTKPPYYHLQGNEI